MSRTYGSEITLLLEYLDDHEPKSLSIPMEILAWSWGSHGDKELQALSLTKYIGVESPHIMKMVATKQKIKQVTMTVENENTIVLVLTNAHFSHQNIGGSGGESRLTENVCLSFSKIEMKTRFLIDKVAHSSKATVSEED